MSHKELLVGLRDHYVTLKMRKGLEDCYSVVNIQVLGIFDPLATS